MTTAQRMVDRTVADLVTERPARSRVFERHGLDYCCGGGEPLAAACAKRGIDAEAVAEELAAADAETDADAGEIDWSRRSLTELVDHIEQTHHAYLRRELPRLGQLLDKVAEAHGSAHPWTRDLRQTLRDLAAELRAHMGKEEQILFPWIRSLESGTDASSPSSGHGIDAPIRVMEEEHRAAARALERLRERSGGYVAPADACGTFRAALDGLAELEGDMHRHIHKENHVLFPRAARASTSASPTRC